MKRNCCNQCRREIDSQDFYLETKRGKICSDCLIQAGPVNEDCATLFKPRGPREKIEATKERRANVIHLPLKEAL